MIYRLLAFVLLLLYIFLILIGGLVLLNNIGITIIFGATAVLLMYASWIIFANEDGGGMLAKFLVGIAGVGLFVELLYFLIDENNRQALILFMLITILYLGIFSVIRNKYWALMRKQAEERGDTTVFKKPYLIINPKSGNGRAIKAKIDQLAEQQGIAVIFTQKGVDVADSAMEAVQNGADILGISGGDGSIGAVAKVAIEHGLPIVVLPGGTRCHFARDLGLDPKQIVDSLAGFTGVERRVDIGDINGRIFLNNASFGLYADIVDNPDYRENKLKVSRRVLRSIVSGKKDSYDLRFSYEDVLIKKAVQVLVGVNRYQTMSLFEFGHRQKLDEGVLQVTTVTKLSNQLIKQLLSVVNIRTDRQVAETAGMYQWVNKSLTIKSSNSSLVVGVDGERESYKVPVNIRVLPKALRIYVPAEGVRSRRKSPFSNKVISKIWKVIIGSDSI